jgi:hypothetical protein
VDLLIPFCQAKPKNERVKLRINGRRAEEILRERDSRLNVAITYDAPGFARRAIRLVDGLASNFADLFQVSREVWRFDILELPEVHDQIRKLRNRADLVIVATGLPELPAAVKSFLEGWSLERAPDSAALVALLQTPASIPKPSSAYSFMQELAQASGLTFLSTELDPDEDTNVIQPREAHAAVLPYIRIEPRTSSDAQGSARRQMNSSPLNFKYGRHWGINE